MPSRSGVDSRVDLTDTPDDARFRARVRAWIAEHLPAPGERRDQARMRRWHQDLHAGGFIGCSWPKEFAGLAIECEIVRQSNRRNLSDQLHGRLNPGLASALKLFCSELNQRLTEAGHAALGPEGTLFPGGAATPANDSWTYRMLYDRCLTIAGGTSEMQRGIIAQRVLGLPR
jgi:alkylation response protein AidB-like acyl-CoA dehydrogenase